MTLRELTGWSAVCAGFWLFAYNSGYGYDALEHLVIGRSLVDGYALYDFIPSRSFGIYVLVAGFLGLTGTEGHVAASLLTTLIFAGFVGTTRFVVARHFDRPTARLSAFLVAACAPFMEMNFLLSEGPVLIAGLLGYDVLLRAPGHGWKGPCLAGVLIGCGAAFKTVAAFYVLAAMVWLVLPWPGAAPARFVLRAGRAFMLGVGALLPVLGAACYFAATDRLQSHIEWTYTFPLLHFPGNTVFLTKFLAKVSWFLALVGGALAASLLSRRLKRAVHSDPAVALAWLMAGAASLALLKQQASHYFFPAAGFASVFAARVVWLVVGDHPQRRRRALTAAALATCVVAAGVAVYRPDALTRLLRLQDFARERKLGQALAARVPAGRHALFFDDSLHLYWISGLYPTTPFLKIDVQELHFIASHPNVLRDALRDPDLVLVAMRAGGLGVADGRFDSDRLGERVEALVEESFVRDDVPGRRARFWRRAEVASPPR